MKLCLGKSRVDFDLGKVDLSLNNENPLIAIGVKSTLIIMEVIPFLVLAIKPPSSPVVVVDPSYVGLELKRVPKRERLLIVGAPRQDPTGPYRLMEEATSDTRRKSTPKIRYASFEVVGYLAEELRDESTYKTFCKDLEDANVFSGSLIFVEELAQKIKSAVEKERDRLEAVLVFPSMPEVMRLNKLGSFTCEDVAKVLKYLPSDKAQYARIS
ncbi:hypothetical protein Syun_023569 [Stephania yunnanensis]|uniref:magnesium chelatase n=1 Tax=Stephania yunnanensis TaxID=152371 RepID=A0AAP0FN95_9MAGN